MSTPTHDPTIPQPPRFGPLGNLLELQGGMPVQRMMELARRYGPIYRMEVPGREFKIVSGYQLVNELSDERRFDKLVSAPLRNVRAFAGDGLFTAATQEPNWHKAHNILLSNFNMKAMQGYHPMMLDIADQLMLKWQRLNPDDTIDVAEDMTRLTLDTIGLCGFDYRFNSFYRQDSHPFVAAMVRALGEAMAQLRRLPVQEKLSVQSHRQMQSDIDYMNSMVDTIIRERKRSSGNGKQDLLSCMLEGVDKQTGEGLDDLNIRYQIITFLIAGHETTSGLLSFAIYFLMKNPDVLRKAYAEVDRVFGSDPAVHPTYAQVQRLTYVQQILKESLRLWPTAPAFSLYAYQDTEIGGIPVKQGEPLQVLIPMLHRDQSVWGPDAEAFRPERFAPELERQLPPNAYKPFGNGQRACIGRQFALQEAALVLGMILQRFELIDYANYQLTIKETLTLKPEDLMIKVRPRTIATQASAAQPVAGPAPAAQPAAAPAAAPLASNHNTPMLVLYGSNMGTAEAIAQEIAADAETRGFRVAVGELNAYTEKLPTDGMVTIVSASYNGLPPDNANQFCDWLRSPALAADALKGVRYTVFGCGDHNWATTYQAVPALIDDQLAAHGAERLVGRGEADAADDFDGQFRSWYTPLWGKLASALDLEIAGGSEQPLGKRYSVEMVESAASHPFTAAYGAQPMRVLANSELLAAAAERSTRHIELALPDGVSYHAGDHLGVLPRNSAALVGRVLRRFHLNAEQHVVIRRNGAGKSHLPTETPIALHDVLANYVELQDTASRAQIALLAEHTVCPPHKRELEALSAETEAGIAAYRAEIFGKHVSLLDLLERYEACELPFSAYLELLPPLKPRYYSISSSPLASDHAASLTVGVVDAPARSGAGRYQGVASSYLASQAEGSVVYGFVRSPNAPFAPAAPAVPMIMVGPGTGLAPFRGFLQERAAQQAQGTAVAPSLLFFGCRRPDHDFLYEQELRSYEQQGIVELVTAFSRVDGQDKCYVQHRIGEHSETIWALIERGAVIYICGDAGAMAPDVRAAFRVIYQAHTGADAEQAEAWIASLEASGRYCVDVWAAS